MKTAHTLKICAGIGILAAAGWLFVGLMAFADFTNPTARVIFKIGYVVCPAIYLHPHGYWKTGCQR